MTTKAQHVRDILAANKGKKLDDLVEQVMKKTGLSKSLSMVYLKNNAGKASTKAAKKATKTKVAKTTSAKKTEQPAAQQ
jgi:folate-dependent phosphoribosylglycinamide formyltransferase PurN